MKSSLCIIDRRVFNNVHLTKFDPAKNSECELSNWIWTKGKKYFTTKKLIFSVALTNLGL